MGHWSDDISRADADEIASALGLELEYDADDGLEALKAHAATLAAEHAALRRQVEELRYAAGSWHKAAQRGADQERARCLAWVERLIAVWADPEQAGVKMSLGDVVAGIGSGEWPLDQQGPCAADLGIVLVCYPAGRVEYVATPLQHAREAIELVQRIPLLMGADHPTAHHETDHIVHHMGDLVRWLDVPDEEE